MLELLSYNLNLVFWIIVAVVYGFYIYRKYKKHIISRKGSESPKPIQRVYCQKRVVHLEPTENVDQLK